jgi:DNA polymerase III delta subunit
LAAASQADVRRQIAAGKVAAIYLLLGADEAAKIALAGEFLELVEADLRAFNVDRLYGGETTGAQVVDAARTLPMMAQRRVVLLLHAELGAYMLRMWNFDQNAVAMIEHHHLPDRYDGYGHDLVTSVAQLEQPADPAT